MAFNTSFLFLVLLTLSTLTGQVPAQCYGTAETLNATDATKTFSTSGYPYYYSNNLNCTWKIKGNERNIFIVINDFNTEQGYDFISISDWNSSTSLIQSLLLYHSGTLIPGTSYKSTSGGLYVTFTTDSTVTRIGANFAFIQLPAWESRRCGEIHLPRRANTFVTLVRKGDWNPNPEIQTGVHADGTILTANSTDQFLMYGSALYSSVDSSRSWTIRSTSLVNITVTYRRLVNDILYIYDGANDTGSVLASLTGTDQPSEYTYTSTNMSIYIRYSLYPFSRYEGIIIKYKSSSNSATTRATTTTTTTVATYTGCGSLSLLVTLSAQYLQSPGYPNGYANNLYCTWTLYTDNTNSSINLTIVDMQLEDCCDKLYIYDGPSTSYSLRMTYTNTMSNVAVLGSGQSMHLVFSTDGSVIYRGFRLRYNSASRRLPSTIPVNATIFNVTTESKTISYPGTGLYSNNLNIFWLLMKDSESNNIVIRITRMDIENQISCSYDALSIYDGPDVYQPRLAKLCGSSTGDYQDRSGLYILIHFSTDASVARTGFTLKYYIGMLIQNENKDENKDTKLTPGAIAGICVAVVIAFIVLCVIYKLRCQAKRVKPGTPSTPLPPPSSTRKLWMKAITKLDSLPQPKVKRKTSPEPKPSPAPKPPTPDPNIIIIHKSTPQPLPVPSPLYPDPAYPSVFPGPSNMAPPSGTQGEGFQYHPTYYNPLASRPLPFYENIPDPFVYLSPADVRK